MAISTHAPHAGCDLRYYTNDYVGAISIPTPSKGRYRGLCCREEMNVRISTLTPRGGATHLTDEESSEVLFQFPRPVWGATSVGGFPDNGASITTPAPHVGCDSMGTCPRRQRPYFNSRTP